MCLRLLGQEQFSVCYIPPSPKYGFISMKSFRHHAALGFPEPKWNPTCVLLMKGRPIKKRGHTSYKKKGEDLTPTGTEELKSTASMPLGISLKKGNYYNFFI